MKLSREIESVHGNGTGTAGTMSEMTLVWHVQVQMEDFLLNLNMCRNRLIR